jgi:hypothetical protein
MARMLIKAESGVVIEVISDFPCTVVIRNSSGVEQTFFARVVSQEEVDGAIGNDAVSALNPEAQWFESTGAPAIIEAEPTNQIVEDNLDDEEE